MQAILNDCLGIEVDLLVARMFMREVVAGLQSEFELDGGDIARWLSDRLAAALREERERRFRCRSLRAPTHLVDPTALAWEAGG